MPSKLNKAIIKSVSGQLSVYIVQFLALIIYARLFSPEEFGIIASIQVFVLFFQMIANVGIGPAIINEDEFESKKRDGIFTVTAIMGGILAVLFFFFSYSLNSFYGEYEYQQIAILVCVAILFNSLSIVPTTALNKDTKFLKLASINALAECIALAFVYSLYLQNFGVLALAIRPAIQAIVKFVFIWCVSSNTELGRANFGSELYHIKSILAFSLYQFGFNVINFFSRNLDNILIAKYFGMSFVGVYEKSYQLMRYPLMVTTFAMAPAIQPVLTKVRNNKDKVIKEHNSLTCKLLAISIPISIFIYLNAENIVIGLFGKQWVGVIPLIKIFSLMIPIQAVSSSSGAFFQVMNKPHVLFVSGAISAFVNVTGIVIGIVLGEMEYVAFALVIGFSINFFQTYFTLFKYCFGTNPKEFYFGLLKVVCVVLLPSILYCVINIGFITRYSLSVWLDLLVNILVGFMSIFIFYTPLKKILQNS
ncbi:lipopolysaccharide biosynthesis protein [Algibacillus agarilyticus]|uniref:lipopolysaccharide biosynthesis protein n=1 Tax=Algibacillus agarilyticus TaxID=2234133 RepID=UPI000DD02ECF|nr:lipopolysaccharide biosynthesis protein [Algibacillus agarilyticus]